MAVLNDTDRWEVWRDLMKAATELAATWGITKIDIRAAVDGVDNGLEANATTINNWFPQPARSSLTPRQKAFFVAMVALRRALRSS
jgi:hypothetical protein